MSKHSLLQLLRICSPTLPIGSYAYSQGLETACHNEYVSDQESLYKWIIGLLENSMAYLDIPIFSRLYDAHMRQSCEDIRYWNDYILASRETSELLLEDTQMGGALARLLVDLGLNESTFWKKNPCSLLTTFSLACAKWEIEKTTATQGLVWSWCENQVGIGVKLIPLGQTSGQLILSDVMQCINDSVTHGLDMNDDLIGATCPGAVMASMQHEQQYTRLFRS
ncbi:MAG: urease accessory protein UreF [Gammaproteobacteria bacterium]|nr:urease accessory protein UreF [Gammaproteobacteria bacterium]